MRLSAYLCYQLAVVNLQINSEQPSFESALLKRIHNKNKSILNEMREEFPCHYGSDGEKQKYFC